jgi:YVTN family beta-propeller protein
MSNSSALRHVVIAVLGCAAVAGAQIVLNTVTVGDSPNALAVDTTYKKVFVSCEGVDSVYVLDATADLPEEFVIGKVPVGDYPTAVVWNASDNTMWVVNKEINSPSGSVTVIDASTNSAITTVAVGALPTKAVWASTSNKLYTLELQTSTVIDCASNQLIGMIGVPDGMFSFTDMAYNPSMDRLYLTAKHKQGGESKLHVVDCTIDQIIQTVDIAQGPAKMCYAPSVNRLFIACNVDRTMNVIDCASNAVVGWLPISEGPTDVIWSTTPVNRIWVACEWAHTVQYMRADLLEIEGRINTPNRNPRKLLYSPHTTKVLAASEQTHEIIFYNARIPGVVDTIRLAPFSYGPFAMALYPQMNRVFVANYWDKPGTVTAMLVFKGIEESPAKHSLLPSRAMPNPVRAGRLIMLQAAGFEPSRATLADATGRTVYRGGLGRNGALAAPEAPGVYFYTVTDGRLTSSGKFAVR